MPDPYLLIKPLSFFEEFSRKSGEQCTTHYCPGCGHGVIHKLLGEAIDDLGIQDRTILVGSVGCSVFIYYYLETSAVSAPHGRAPAVATGISRVRPDAITVSYQGDGDLAAIGLSHTLHAANRGENAIVIFVNNNTYGMTGGQLAPTSLIGQKTATTPLGRSLENEGPPLKIAEMIAALSSPVFVARGAVNNPRNVRKCRDFIHRGIQAQLEKKGYVFIEILAQCPTNWRLSPSDSCDWIENVVAKEFPLGVLKDVLDEVPARFPVLRKCDVTPENDSADTQCTELSESEELGSTRLRSISEELRIKCAGFGGQGVLSLGQGFANIAMSQGLEVTWLPSYGPEMRGGVANCSVVISPEGIGSPIVEHPDVLIAMNGPSLVHFGPTVPDAGHVFYNSSLVDEVPSDLHAKLHPIPATEIAVGIGNAKVCNSVLLGFAAKTLGIFSLEEIKNFVCDTFPDGTARRNENLAAVEAGWGISGE
ncbi:MAG: 2-oxoacid:acceptor oxidoreductase family protein [Thermoguttaceae bacterium]